MDTHRTRRQAVGVAGLAAAGALLPAPFSGALGAPARVRAGSAKRVLRLAHLTDIHVMPEKRAAEGLGACLDHVQSLADRPELILTGGDSLMDSFEAGYDRTRLHRDLWKKDFK